MSYPNKLRSSSKVVIKSKVDTNNSRNGLHVQPPITPLFKTLKAGNKTIKIDHRTIENLN